MMHNFQDLLLILSIPTVVSYEVDQDVWNLFIQACEEANKEIQANGMLRQPQITQPQTLTLSASLIRSPAIFDPINQFPMLFNGAEMKLLCPLCARIGLQQNIIDTVQWKNRKSPCLL